MDTEQLAPSEEERPNPGEYIMIPRLWLVAGSIGLAAFVLGGILGYVLALTTVQRGISDTLAAAQEAISVAGSGPQVAAQPTSTPTYVANVSVDDDPSLGPADAPVTIVEFSDFQCPYCKVFHDQTVSALFSQYQGQIRLVYRDFPLSSLHPDAEKAAEAAECADEQGKFWEMHDALFTNQQLGLGVDALKGYAQDIGLDMTTFNVCLDSGKYTAEVQADEADGVSYGVYATPTFFINGYQLVGAQPLFAFQSLIDQQLNNN